MSETTTPNPAPIDLASESKTAPADTRTSNWKSGRLIGTHGIEGPRRHSNHFARPTHCRWLASLETSLVTTPAVLRVSAAPALKATRCLSGLLKRAGSGVAALRLRYQVPTSNAETRRALSASHSLVQLSRGELVRAVADGSRRFAPGPHLRLGS